jgi:hypothetical protein
LAKAATCAASSTSTATGVPTGTPMEPSGMRILATKPSSVVSKACVHTCRPTGRQKQGDFVRATIGAHLWHATHTRTHVRTHARTRARAYARTHARTHTRTHAHTHTRRGQQTLVHVEKTLQWLRTPTKHARCHEALDKKSTGPIHPPIHTGPHARMRPHVCAHAPPSPCPSRSRTASRQR